MLLMPLTAHAEIVFTDDLGRQVRLERPAARIVALYGAYSEILLAMDLGELLVGRTDADDQLAAVAHLPSIGTHMRPNAELIIGLSPDLILQMGGREEAVQAVYDLDRIGMTTAYFTVDSFPKLLDLIGLVGTMTGHESRARSLVSSLRDRLEQVLVALSTITERPAVFFEVRAGNLLAAGQGSMVTSIIENAGGTNCIRDDGKMIRINEEELLRLDPDVYIMQEGPMNPAPPPLDERPRIAHLPAAINKRFFTVSERLFSRPGPQNVHAVEILARILHPEAFTTTETRKIPQ